MTLDRNSSLGTPTPPQNIVKVFNLLLIFFKSVNCILFPDKFPIYSYIYHSQNTLQSYRIKLLKNVNHFFLSAKMSGKIATYPQKIVIFFVL